ncbi:MAG TPA: heavy metal-associated domain-containing protein [Thermoplasmata archaeon]|nr:heavy metal-associated domain-containing protein [Thermoplasmata archaeon]
MASAQRIVFAIRGLECASCAIDVGRALRKIPGIAEININYVINKGYVEFDPEKITWEIVSKALTDRGYTVVRTR